MLPPPHVLVQAPAHQILKINHYPIFSKINKFLIKIQLKFLVMIEKSIFAYKLFLILNMLDFILFFM